jgi:hypothetical protein
MIKHHIHLSWREKASVSFSAGVWVFAYNVLASSPHFWQGEKDRYLPHLPNPSPDIISLEITSPRHTMYSQ